jgi:hypothetical protein
MNRLHRWQDWKAFEACPGFITWAEPAPKKENEERYAVVRYQNSIRWARVSPNPDVPTDYSSGAFYDTDDPNDHPEGAVEWAKTAARVHKAHIRKLTSPRSDVIDLRRGAR